VNDEYERHREFLVKSVQELKGALDEEVVHNAKGLNELMKTNLSLIDQINKQREDNKKIKETVYAATGRLTHLARVAAEKLSQATKEAEAKGTTLMLPAPPAGTQKKGKKKSGGSGAVALTSGSSGEGNNYISLGVTSAFSSKEQRTTETESNPLFILERNRRRMQTLRLFITELENRMISMNPATSSTLPPIDFTSAQALNGGPATTAFSIDEEIAGGPSIEGFRGFNDSLDLMSPTTTTRG
jgi:hypothetical protein